MVYDVDHIFGKVIGAIHKMVGRRDGERCKHGVSNVVKQFAKFYTTSTDNI